MTNPLLRALARRASPRRAELTWTPMQPSQLAKLAAIAGLVALISAGFHAAPAAATTAAMHKTHSSGPAVKTSLYKRLGGKKAIRAVVDDFVANVAADERINRYFAKTNIPRFKQRLVEQLCQGTGGPCTYRGRSMKASHRGLGISGAEFGALVEDLQKSLNKFNVPAREQKDLIAILAPMKPDIVERR